jgi:hypothetical protein
MTKRGEEGYFCGQQGLGASLVAHRMTIRLSPLCFDVRRQLVRLAKQSAGASVLRAFALMVGRGRFS